MEIVFGVQCIHVHAWKHQLVVWQSNLSCFTHISLHILSPLLLPSPFSSYSLASSHLLFHSPTPLTSPFSTFDTAKDHVEISHPKQMQELTLQTMKNMLQKQRRTYETLSVNYSKSPSEKLGRDIQDCESIIKLLESEIASKSPPIDVSSCVILKVWLSCCF